jgi:hypothetical protein
MALNKPAFECLIDRESTIIAETSRYGLPSNIKDNLYNYNMDWPNNKPLKKSTLFQSI